MFSGFGHIRLPKDGSPASWVHVFFILPQGVAAVTSETPNDKLSFEQALAKLTELVASLESGELPLEESVAAFEQGVQLSRRCEALLDQAEQRLQVLNSGEKSE
jgi:exodeoxyribonuclease VII small subunit